MSSQEGNQEMTIVQIHTTLTFFFYFIFLALLWLFLFYHHQTDETEKNVEDKYECGGEGGRWTTTVSTRTRKKNPTNTQ